MKTRGAGGAQSGVDRAGSTIFEPVGRSIPGGGSTRDKATKILLAPMSLRHPPAVMVAVEMKADAGEGGDRAGLHDPRRVRIYRSQDTRSKGGGGHMWAQRICADAQSPSNTRKVAARWTDAQRALRSLEPDKHSALSRPNEPSWPMPWRSCVFFLEPRALFREARGAETSAGARRAPHPPLHMRGRRAGGRIGAPPHEANAKIGKRKILALRSCIFQRTCQNTAVSKVKTGRVLAGSLIAYLL